jgi:enamine deaminase RidA (YjgF/YER057c/UK114 family)
MNNGRLFIIAVKTSILGTCLTGLVKQLRISTIIFPEVLPDVLKYVSMDNLTAEERFAQLGLTLPPAPAPLGVYKPCLVDGKYLYLSGHGTVQDDGTLIIGRIGADMDQEAGKLAARQVGLAMLATIKANIGSLDKIKRVIKVLGMVNCTPDFEKHPYVINGCSELFAEVWGRENGIGVRSAVGFGSLPDNIPVEIEALFELH